MADFSDPVILARIQFAFTVSFHIIFPATSIGLASFLAFVQWRWMQTREEVYLTLFDFWIKPFAVVFGMGVVSGLMLSYEFGTNWSVFADKAGPVIGPLMGYEVMTAFFVEAGFLGVMLFGRDKVGPRLHFFATFMVAAGTLGSAFWILSVNSWMQTPAGYGMNEAGQFIPLSWMEVIFNPSFPYRFVHMVFAAYLTTALVVAATAAYHLRRARQNRTTRKMFSLAMWIIAIVAPLQILAGDQHGLNTYEHQPAKVAALEGHFKTRKAAPEYIFGWPNMETGEIDYAVSIPYLGSWILTHDFNAEVVGLDQFPREDWPNVNILFWSFRIMVGLGLLFFTLGCWGLWKRYRGQLYDSPRLAQFALMLGPTGYIAVLCGWVTTEVGRQPYTIYGLLRTSDSVSPVAAPAVATSLAAIVVVYLFVFGLGTLYTLRLLAKDPPDSPAEQQRGLLDQGGRRAVRIWRLIWPGREV
ncbi:cytochrome ubiquinol oxidase subunit I [Hoeflea prorocentri]|uniref:Cytochrome ubiquinol oxidase subunit I n=1 Tax=Hoeflea prorocentri TaxID=1922333 RepID=A0A9X3UF50_9HYPH|nr:cytochrome ubiquinol oxidase subunit I [Hoeflea prorocentri]MCY6379479.1 cytochrome ubiquinol oxidase subunit I [Hoeflea prorocentri]MDA5397279.1 cytochrome ubiquinol oxidase subunit I [Hoeflea prorocentri]